MEADFERDSPGNQEENSEVESSAEDRRVTQSKYLAHRIRPTFRDECGLVCDSDHVQPDGRFGSKIDDDKCAFEEEMIPRHRPISAIGLDGLGLRKEEVITNRSRCNEDTAFDLDPRYRPKPSPEMFKKFHLIVSALKDVQMNMVDIDSFVSDQGPLHNNECSSGLSQVNYCRGYIKPLQETCIDASKSDEAKLNEILALLHSLTDGLSSYEQIPLFAEKNKGKPQTTQIDDSRSATRDIATRSGNLVRGIPLHGGNSLRETKSLWHEIDNAIKRKDALDEKIRLLVTQGEVTQESVDNSNEAPVESSNSALGLPHEMVNEGDIEDLRHDEEEVLGLADTGLSNEINSLQTTIQEIIEENKQFRQFFCNISVDRKKDSSLVSQNSANSKKSSKGINHPSLYFETEDPLRSNCVVKSDVRCSNDEQSNFPASFQDHELSNSILESDWKDVKTLNDENETLRYEVKCLLKQVVMLKASMAQFIGRGDVEPKVLDNKKPLDKKMSASASMITENTSQTDRDWERFASLPHIKQLSFDSEVTLRDEGIYSGKMNDGFYSLQRRVDFIENYLKRQQNFIVPEEVEPCMKFLQDQNVLPEKNSSHQLNGEIFPVNERELYEKIIKVMEEKERLSSQLDEMMSLTQDLSRLYKSCQRELRELKKSQSDVPGTEPKDGSAFDSEGNLNHDNDHMESKKSETQSLTYLQTCLAEEKLQNQLLRAAEIENSARVAVLQKSLRDKNESNHLLMSKYQRLHRLLQNRKAGKNNQKEVFRECTERMEQLNSTTAAIEINYKAMLSTLGHNIEIAVEILSSHLFFSSPQIHPCPKLTDDPAFWFAAQCSKVRWLQNQLRQLCLQTWKSGGILMGKERQKKGKGSKRKSPKVASPIEEDLLPPEDAKAEPLVEGLDQPSLDSSIWLQLSEEEINLTNKHVKLFQSKSNQVNQLVSILKENVHSSTRKGHCKSGDREFNSPSPKNDEISSEFSSVTNNCSIKEPDSSELRSDAPATYPVENDSPNECQSLSSESTSKQLCESLEMEKLFNSGQRRQNTEAHSIGDEGFNDSHSKEVDNSNISFSAVNPGVERGPIPAFLFSAVPNPSVSYQYATIIVHREDEEACQTVN